MRGTGALVLSPEIHCSLIKTILLFRIGLGLIMKNLNRDYRLVGRQHFSIVSLSNDDVREPFLQHRSNDRSILWPGNQSTHVFETELIATAAVGKVVRWRP